MIANLVNWRGEFQRAGDRDGPYGVAKLMLAFAMATKNSSPGSREMFTIGRARFERISAVEGIKTSPEIQALFAEFDRQGFTPEQRRAAIRARFTPLSRPSDEKRA